MVKVFTAEESVTVGSTNFNNVIADFKDGDIKGTATKVEYCDFFICFLVKTISK